ncbi:MAG: glycosyl hydrolase-related protein [Bifidobacteriaceae bacterium]|nr:glycosyl hydrolase-related protein [Bifidobacteriaceae bacterium]
MHDDTRLVEARIARFLETRIAPARIAARAPVDLARWDVEGEPASISEGLAAPYRPARRGEPWGAPWTTTWLRIRGKVPEGWTAAELEADLGFDQGRPGFQAEGLVVRPDGTIVKGINPRNRHVRLEPGPFELYIEAAGNPNNERPDFSPILTGDRATSPTEPAYSLRGIVLINRDTQVEALFHDVEVLAHLMRVLPQDGERRHGILRALEGALDLIGADPVGVRAAQAREVLRPVLARPANASAHALTAIGHAHIDSAWLWPVRETVRKCARTFANALDLMDRDPEFIFGASSAQQYAWMKEFYPELFKRIAARVREGRFVPLGQLWVESDTNLPSGESMARQFIEGAAFFREEFGVEPEVVWLPDSFGYSGALPQIAAAAGARGLLAQKLSWNDTDQLPHHTFWWEGIDGTRLFTHFPPIDTYLSDLSAEDLAHATRNNGEKGRFDASIAPFGYGDGGGGPTPTMLERARRLRSLEGSPRLAYGTPTAFFDHARQQYADAAVWAGELYLEFHRGVYSSQASLKRGNRQAERLLHEAELWAASASLRRGLPYPGEELRRLWRELLLQQFHDIVPGSSIAWVNQDARAALHRVANAARAIIDRSLGALVGEGDVELVANPAPVRAGPPSPATAPVPALVLDPISADTPPAGATTSRRSAPGSRAYGGPATATRLPSSGAHTFEVPAFGVVIAERPPPTALTPSTNGWKLDNGLLAVGMDSAGGIVSLIDHLTGREAVAPGEVANRLELHPDVPTSFDAWNLETHHVRGRTVLAATGRARPLAGGDGVAVTLEHEDCRATQTIRLLPERRSLSIEIAVDWAERDRLLVLAVPLDLRAEYSTSEIQFGHIRRPVHQNTSWDAARFEFCAQRFIHVGEPSYGVAIANECCYGHSVTRRMRADGGTTTTVFASLLRSTHYPDPGRDHGHHEFVVTIRPGAGLGEAVEEGYLVNLPTRLVRGAGPVPPIVASANPAVPIETVKLSEDGRGDLIVRLYEARGDRAATAIRLGVPHGGVCATDLHERAIPELPVASGGDVELTLRPFELVTLRFATGADGG